MTANPAQDADLLLSTAIAGSQAHSLDRDLACSQLAALAVQPVDQAILTHLRRQISQSWSRGWQPADLLRVVRRETADQHSAMALDAVVADLDQHGPALAGTWRTQLTGATRWWSADGSWASEWASRHRHDRLAMVIIAVELAALLAKLPRLPLLSPPPGQLGHADTGAEASLDDRTLARVRALLAKAESTTYPQEAEAYSAKAQELIARHSIDQALVAARSDHREEPTAIRLGVDAPYEAEKSLLLAGVADANNCQSVWSTSMGFATVFGFTADVRLVDLLYTSLLVQATAAMTAEGVQRDRAGRSMSRSFRQSFLTAYAARIGERLAEAAQQENDRAAETVGATALLPVLAAREEQVTSKARTMFPQVKSKRFVLRDGAGATAGRTAADQASLHAAEPAPQQAGRQRLRGARRR